MKDFGPDKKIFEYEEDDIDLLKDKQNNSPNADIQYLLSYINIKKSQQLNLTQQFSQLNNSNQQIPHSSLLSKYITECSVNHQQQRSVDQRQQRQTLVQIIDSGIRLISRIKSMMNKKRQQQLKKDKNSTLGRQNPFQTFKQLFFGSDNSTSNATNNRNTSSSLSNGNKNSSEMMMKLFRIEQQVQMLLHKSEFSNNQNKRIKEDGQKEIEGLETRTYKYMLTMSLYEEISEGLSDRVNDTKSKLSMIEKVSQLEDNLIKLEEMESTKNNHTNNLQNNKRPEQKSLQQQYEKHLTGIWTLIDQLSTVLSPNPK